MNYYLPLLLVFGCAPAPPPIAPAVPVKAAPAPVPVQDKVPYLKTIRDSAEMYYGVPAPVPMIVAQIEQESAFNPKAVSPVGATGLMQFMPATAKWAAQAGGFGVAAPLDPEWSIRAGVWYDRHLYDRVLYANSVCDRHKFALSGYNGGEKRVRDRQALSPSPGNYAITSTINPGISEANQRENAAYPLRIVYALQPKYASLGLLVCKGDT